MSVLQTPYLPHRPNLDLSTEHTVPYPIITNRQQLRDTLKIVRPLPDKILYLGNDFISEDTHCSLPTISTLQTLLQEGMCMCVSLCSFLKGVCPISVHEGWQNSIAGLWKVAVFPVSVGWLSREARQKQIMKPNKIKQNTEQLLEAKKSVSPGFCYGCALSIIACKQSWTGTRMMLCNSKQAKHRCCFLLNICRFLSHSVHLPFQRK